jgi:threonine synthase
MDVGNPSNFQRMLDLFDGSHRKMSEYITGYSYTDESTRRTIQKTFALTGYTLDPHGAVGYMGLEDYLKSNDGTGIVLETAHPVKFRDTVEQEVHIEIPMPEHINQTDLEKTSIPFSKEFNDFKDFLMERA